MKVLRLNSEEVGSTTSKGIDFLARIRASRPKENASFFHVIYIGYHKKDWPRLKMDLPTSKELN